MTTRDPNNDMLDDILAQARAVAPTPGDDLFTRVLADAAQVSTDRARPAPRPGPWVRMRETLGGWPGLGGLAAATIAGVWIGIAPPASVQGLTAGLMGETVSVSLFVDTSVFETGEASDG